MTGKKFKRVSKKIPLSEVKKHKEDNDCWTVINQRVYDISTFVNSHPGGRLILACAGDDGTVLYETHHPFDKRTKAIKYLENYYIGDIAEKDEGITYKFSPMYEALCRLLWDKGIQREANKQNYVVLIKALFVVLTICIGYYWSVWKGCYVGAFTLGCGLGWLGMNIMHDANHQGLRWKWYNLLGGWSLQLLGGNKHVWTYSHITHHAHANQVDDPDTSQPWIRYRNDEPQYKWSKYQHVYAWFLYTLTVIGFRTQAIAWLMDQRHYKDVNLPKTDLVYYYISLFLVPFTLLGHYLLPCYLWGIGYGVTSGLIADLVGGFMITWVFQVNHLTATTHLRPGTLLNPKHDWCIDQIHGSNDFLLGPSDSWLNWSMTMHTGGLNYQIEHHLFPCLPHMTMPFVSQVLRPLCAQFKVNYEVHSNPWKAVSSHYALLKHFATASAATTTSAM